ncbi:unnamed protein product [Discula destructiva]
MDPRRAEQIKLAREMEFREVHGCAREAHSNRPKAGFLSSHTTALRPEMSRSSSVSSQGSAKAPSPTLIKSGDDIWR